MIGPISQPVEPLCRAGDAEETQKRMGHRGSENTENGLRLGRRDWATEAHTHSGEDSG